MGSKPRDLLLVLLLLHYQEIQAFTLNNGDITLEVTPGADATSISLKLGDNEKLLGQIGQGIALTPTSDCEGSSQCELQSDDITLTISSSDNGFTFVWLTENLNVVFQDCLDLVAGVSWFGGPEKWQALWPIESTEISDRAYVVSKQDSSAISERYWLNSLGGYIFVDDNTPLFLDQNNIKESSICFLARVADPYLGRNRISLKYDLVARSDPKEAQLHAVEQFLGKPTGFPNVRLIQEPIWTTWAKYKKDIEDNVVKAFAQDIYDHGFTGQIEIDDYWEVCYGSLTFRDDKFSDISNTVQTLKDLGFTVTLWTHPFVNDDCTEFATIGKDNNYFVKNISGSDVTDWWDGNPAYHIDYTNEEARNWFVERLEQLRQNHGIDNFKFDAGESDWPPINPSLTGDVESFPNLITSNYVRTCATFGDRLEVRSGWRTQDLPVFVRMLDKDSRWGLDNGLHTLITSLLQMNIVGYTLVLPDMIGGNGYGEQPTAELIVRWMQANTFMPTMQFSYLPWDFPSDDFDGVAIIKKFVALHKQYFPSIIAAISDSMTVGTPVNPPVWWVDPEDVDSWAINDQYMLGENILVAPVIQESAVTRNIYLPRGDWVDGNNGKIISGPTTLIDYPAPIDVLPYFIKN